MRLFVAVAVPDAVAAIVSAMARPDLPDVRWTTPEQWHVTLRYIGNHDDPGAIAGALDTVAWATPVEAQMGPASAWFPGRRVLQVPVDGLQGLAEAVREATAGLGEPPENRFRGHLTLARVRGQRPGPAELAGAPLQAAWLAPDLRLYSSTPARGGSRYEVLHRLPLPA
ncbi:MAG: RNA 2',3'-cyclic phosphodiesterase [Acidimicrobiales bacterium]